MTKRILSLLLAAVLALGLLSAGASPVTASAISNIVKLDADITNTLDINADTVVDLNGHSITGDIVFNGGKLYVLDSSTDDYTEAGCGKITGAISDETSLLGATPNEVAGITNSYLKVKEGSTYSFHAVNLTLTDVSLRPNQVGMYYSCDFQGDEAVQRALQADGCGYGIAFSVNEAPKPDDSGSFPEKTASFFAGSTWGNAANTTSTLLEDIMTPTNGYAANDRNASLPVYGCAYLRTADGCLLGAPRSYSLKSFMALADGQYGTMTDTQKENLLQMYDTYKDHMKYWDIPNLKADAELAYQNRPLNVLIIGHSLGMDAMTLLPEVIKTENPGVDFTLGMLYHSGCTLNQHVSYLGSDAAQYAYFEYTQDDTQWRRSRADGTWEDFTPGMANDTLIADGTIARTMQFGIQQHDWDIVMMQAGVFEAANYTTTLNKTHIGIIRQYVLDNDINAATVPEFGWNMTWTCPNDENLLKLNGGYYLETLNKYPGDTIDGKAMDMYNRIASTLKNVVEPTIWSLNFKYRMPSGTAMQNANSSYLATTELYRDNIHARDFTRLMTSYLWYINLTGKDISELSFDVNINDVMLCKKGSNFTLSEAYKNILIESITNAMANPYAVTQSQYTTAP